MCECMQLLLSSELIAKRKQTKTTTTKMQSNNQVLAGRQLKYIA